MKEGTKVLLEAVANLVVSGLLVSLILGYFITKRDEKIKNSIQEEFKKRDTFFNAQFNYKQRAVEELLGPIMMQLKRSALTVQAYEPNNAYREGILKECNETVRELLLKKGFLIPTELLPDATDLIRHYDEWLQLYQQIRIIQNDRKTPFVFTYNFPHEAEKNFLKTYDDFRKELKVEEKMK